MTSRKTTSPPGKRERLIQAARRSYHRHGLANSTLKVVAAEAHVPLGNVYYYFPTREALTRAMVQERLNDLRTWLTTCEASTDPRDRIIAYLDAVIESAQDAACYGCAHAALASDTLKQDDPNAALAADVLRTFQSWFSDQWRASWNPELTAEEFFAAVQGAYTVAHGTRDPALFSRLLTQLRERVEHLP